MRKREGGRKRGEKSKGKWRVRRLVCSKRKRGWRGSARLSAALDGRRMAREQISLFFPLDTHYICLNIAGDRIQETRMWREGSGPPPLRTRTLEPSFIHGKRAADVYAVAYR